MKTLAEIEKSLTDFEKRFGFSVQGAPQGSLPWMQMKLGVLSSSNASRIVAKADSDTRHTYMCELVAEIATGIMEEINSKYIEWGNQHEDSARAHYEFLTGNKVDRLSFVYKDDTYREGCSPDGIVGPTCGVEIKCPFNSVHYIKFLVDGSMRPEYRWQYQYVMRVMDCENWDFVQFDPRMKSKPMKIIKVIRDEEMQKKLDDHVPKFIEDMDAMLAQIGFKFGDQWTRLREKQTS